MWVYVCVYTHTHTHFTDGVISCEPRDFIDGVLGCEPRSLDETPGGPGELRS